MKYEKNIETIFEKVYIETPVDTDGDGKYDLIVAWITRPKSTLDGEKVPAVLVANPYLMTCNEDLYNLHDVDRPLKVYDEENITLESIKSKYNPTPEYQCENLESKGEVHHAITDEVPVFDAITPMYSYLAQKGYATVYSGGLGTLDSDGFTLTGSREEVLAFKSIIDWMCGRARGFTDKESGIEVKAYWCNQKVAMSAKSYLGTLQYAVAATGVEGLEAIIPEAAISNWYEYYRTNGLCVSPMEWQGDDCDLLALYCMSRLKNKADCDKFEKQYMALREKYIELEDRDSGNYNAFWDERNYLAHGEKYNVPTFIIHGINDWNVKTNQCGRAFDFLQRNNIDRKMLLHQGEHIYVYDLKGCRALELIEKWLAHYLRGEEGIDLGPRVLVQSNIDQFQWYESEEWPPKSMNYFKFPIDSKATKITIVDDISKTVFSKGENNLVKWREELILGDLDNKIAFEWNPWKDFANEDECVRISGAVKVSFSASINQSTAILSAMLVDLGEGKRLTGQQISAGDSDNPDLFQFAYESENSNYKVISRGWLNAQNIQGDYVKTNIEPFRQYEFKFEMIPTEYFLPKGHKLGLILYGIDAEFTQRPSTITKTKVDIESIDVKIPLVLSE